MQIFRCVALVFIALFGLPSFAEDYSIQPGDELTISLPGEEAFQSLLRLIEMVIFIFQRSDE